MLSNFYFCPIVTKDGEFKSVEGYWYYLSLPITQEKEKLRELSGFQAKKIGNELRKQHETINIEDFEDRILRAILDKCKRKYQLFKVDHVKLPFEHYYNYGGKVVDVKDKYIWMIDGIEKIRKYVLNKIEVNV